MSPTDDPLAQVFAPPPNESQHDKENRVRAEQEAKKRSDAIDEEINKQRNARKNKPVKILLLGEPTVFHRVRLPVFTLPAHQAKANQVRSAFTMLHGRLNPHVPPLQGSQRH